MKARAAEKVPEYSAPPTLLRMKRVARVAWWFAGLFTAGVFLPGLLGVDMMQWGFAAAAFSGFLALTGFVTAVIYRRLARQLAGLFAGQEVLAVWTIPPVQWRGAVEADWKEEQRDKRTLWFIVLGWCVLIGIGFAAIDPEAGGIVLLVLLGVAGICGFAAVLGPRWRKRRQLESAATAWIGRHGVYCGGIFHDWSLPGSSLRSVGAVVDGEGGKRLELTYQFLTGAGLQTETARVPVPPGHEDEALGVAEVLSTQIT